jgi:hypothetical protein
MQQIQCHDSEENKELQLQHPALSSKAYIVLSSAVGTSVSPKNNKMAGTTKYLLGALRL